jgi:hypothetical protein
MVEDIEEFVDGLSGVELIEDLCVQIAEAPSKSTELAGTNSYQRYGAKVSVTLKLEDVDSTEVKKLIVAGELDAEGGRTIEIDIPPVSPILARQRSEQPNPNFALPVSKPPEKRFAAKRTRRKYTKRAIAAVVEAQ